MTALGGMLLLANDSTSSSLVPDTPAHWMGVIATVLSFVNIAGGFLISGKMLDLFRPWGCGWLIQPEFGRGWQFSWGDTGDTLHYDIVPCLQNV